MTSSDHDRIGWRFPPTNGGRVDGFNDPGIAHFSGDPLVSLARETIQNSLDARTGDGPVEVSFEIEQIERHEALARDELAAAVDACLRQLDPSGDDEKAHKTLAKARRLLGRSRLPYLRVSDRNTTGLRGKHWHALLKMQGASVKEGPGAGGSHGIGKYAPFTVSPLRTVLYWTRFHDNGKIVEQFQGKAVLMSHWDNGTNAETQGTGFYGKVDGCEPLLGGEIPRRIRQVEDSRSTGAGTSLWIAGFQTPDWQQQITRSVIASFFHAIDQHHLSVTIEPNAELERLGLLDLNRSTMEDWFQYLADVCDDTDDDDAVSEARDLWQIIRDEPPAAQREDGDLGHCKLWIRVADGLPSKVGFIRGTGMLITTQQQGLIRFRGLRDFVAVCVFDSEKGNELLRRMENPQHDQFQPERLSDHDERKRGGKALRRITKWIRDEVKKRAAPPPSESTTDLDELAAYLPDLQPDEPLDSPKPGDEPSFDGPSSIRLKARRRVPAEPLPADDEQDVAESGNDEGNAGGGRQGPGDTGDEGGGGAGEGGGEGGTGGRGGSRGQDTVAVEDVRLVPASSGGNRYRLAFTPLYSGDIRIELEEAGDSAAVRRTDIEAFRDGRRLGLERVAVVENHRVVFDIVGAEPIAERAWRVHAVKIEEGQ